MLGIIFFDIFKEKMKRFFIGMFSMALLAGCTNNNEESITQKEVRIKNSLDSIMKCNACSIGLQSITFLDSLNQSHTENAYAVLNDGKLIYFTTENFQIILKEQVITYTDIKLLRFHGHEPKD